MRLFLNGTTCVNKGYTKQKSELKTTSGFAMKEHSTLKTQTV